MVQKKNVKPGKGAKLFFPDLRKLGLKHKSWEPNPPYMQSLVPKDRQLSKKLGIRPKEKVLVMAGYHGNWARALANFCDVRYTDIGRRVTEFAKSKGGKIRSFAARPAQALVRRPKVYDWSFLYEPIPVYGIRVVFVRSLLNKKGCKVVGMSPLMIASYLSDIGAVGRLYGAKPTAKSVLVDSISDLRRNVQSHSIDVLTLRTNAEARKKAVLDLKLLQKLSMAAKKGIKLRVEELCKKFGVSRKELQESRKRLDKLAEGIKEEQDKCLR